MAWDAFLRQANHCRDELFAVEALARSRRGDRPVAHDHDAIRRFQHLVE
jgi:hypothetical protein